jgi:NADH-quinone oxidoreductase subunit J
VLYTQYTYPFEIAAVILLVAIVAAVALTLRKRKDTKYFSPEAAVKVKSADRLRIVQMKSESVRPAGDAQPAAPAAENK